jgi:hypothetical protein
LSCGKHLSQLSANEPLTSDKQRETGEGTGVWPCCVLEQSFAEQARQTFENSLTAEPVPELNTDEWRRRLACPIGIDAEGDPFPLDVSNDSQSGEGIDFDVVGNSPLEADDKLETVNEIRQGDIISFERLSADTVAMRALSPEEADAWPSRTYRIDQGSRPGEFRLTEIS